jgi:NADPH:quinone reductase
VIAAVGPGVDRARIGQRVWVWNAGWQRACGTAAEYVALPAEQAVLLPDRVGFAQGACFGIPAMTAWYGVMGDGPVEGQTILVTGGAGSVGRYAVQMARAAGARVIATVSSARKAAHSTAEQWVNYRDTDVVGAVMEITGGAGVDRIVDVDFAANQAASLALIKPGGTIAAYASASDMAPQLSFYPFMFKNVRLHMLIVYQLAGALRRAGERQVTDWLEAGVLSHAVVPGGGLADCAAAHDLVASGDKLGTVVLDI